MFPGAAQSVCRQTFSYFETELMHSAYRDNYFFIIFTGDQLEDYNNEQYLDVILHDVEVSPDEQFRLNWSSMVKELRLDPQLPNFSRYPKNVISIQAALAVRDLADRGFDYSRILFCV